MMLLPGCALMICLSVSLLVDVAIAAAPPPKPQKSGEQTGKVMYRYKNAQGVIVMDSQIPPEYVTKGYDIMSRTGKVLKVVPPAPVGAAAEKALQERLRNEELARTDVHLRRSYSNVADIDAAKARNLQSLRGNIDILEANLSGVRTRMQAAQSRAASIERSGRAVPDDFLNSIRGLEQEEKDIQAQIKQRQVELQGVSDKFDSDRKRFIEITPPEQSNP
jgi:hypothetical protein